MMKSIKNIKGKFVCRVDEAKRIVEIVHKGAKTIVQFTTDGRTEIKNTKIEL